MKMKSISVVVVLLLVIFNLSIAGIEAGVQEQESIVDVNEEELEKDSEKNINLTSDGYPFKNEYPSLDELYEWYEDLEGKFPELVERHNYGESYEGRDLWALEITSDEDTVVDEKPAILIDATIHAREWSTAPVATYLAWRLVDEYETNETINWLVNNREIFIVPMINPDGYVFDGNGDLVEKNYWRKNRNDSTRTESVGVDLNRNWGYSWEEGDDNPSNYTYHGEAPFSEPETNHLKEFILDNDIDSYQNIHSHFGSLLIPSSNTTDPTPHNDWYHETAEHTTSFTSMLGDEEKQYSYGQTHEEVKYGVGGGAMEWVYHETGAQAFTYELYTGEWDEFKRGFYPEEDKIMQINKDVDDSLIYQARVADTDLGDGEKIKNPPVPYLVYGKLKDEEGKAISDVEIEVRNQGTGESISVQTNSKGYFEVNLAGLEEGYRKRDLFRIEIEPGTTRVNFEVDDNWGQRLDLEYSESAQVTTEGFSDLTLESVNLLGKVTLEGEESVEAYFDYRTEADDSWEKTDRRSITDDGIYEIALGEDDLEEGGTYEFRSVIEWGEEMNKGRTVTFIVDTFGLDIDSYQGGEVKAPGEDEFGYTYASEVTIEASAEEDSKFVRWVGDIEALEDPRSKETVVTMYEHYEINALFLMGEGTEDDPYILESVYHLQEINENLDAHFELVDDIDASKTEDWNDGDGFEPISYAGEYFKGTLEGKGHEIQDLHIDRDNEMMIGMFEAIGEEGEINDLRLVDVEITGNMQVGGLTSINWGKIKNSSVTGDVIGKWYVGGLVADSEEDIENSYFKGKVEGNQIVGGLVGHMGGWRRESIPSNVKRSYSNADVSGEKYVGGLVGWNGKGGTISKSYVIGNISAKEEYAGGIVAMNLYTVENSYATGTVKAPTRCGGLVAEHRGWIFSSYSTAKVVDKGVYGGLIADIEFPSGDPVKNSYWLIYSSGVEESADGKGMTTGEMIGEKAKLCMKGFDFAKVWNVKEEPYSYPYLSWQDEENIPYVPYELEHELTIKADGRGSTKPEDSTYLYPEGEEVPIKANSERLVEFSHWEGDVPEENKEDEEMTVVMEDDKEITANFEYALWFKGLVSLIVLSVVVGGGFKVYKKYWKEEESDEEVLVPAELEAREDTEIKTCPECDERALVIYEDGSAFCENCSHAEKG